MPPFVLQAETAASTQVAISAQNNAFSILAMAQVGYLWSMRAFPAAVEHVAPMRARAQNAASVDSARELFQAAEFTSAAATLRALLEQRPDAVDAALLLARIEMRLGEPADALATLTRFGRFARKSAKPELTMLKAVAFARSGDAASARTHFRSAQALIGPDDASYPELIYQIAANEWMERRLDKAEKLLERMPEVRTSEIDLHARILHGAIASASENLAAQGAILLDAIRCTDAAGADVYLYGMLVTQIASLALESAQHRAAGRRNRTRGNGKVDNGYCGSSLSRCSRDSVATRFGRR